jgi:acylphosphatase
MLDSTVVIGQLIMTARRFIVRGRVQGVGFRFFAIREAKRLGLLGAVRNLSDGTVEAIAEGSPGALDEFRGSLRRGPSYSQVESVDEMEIQPTGRYTGFDVSY